MLTVVAEALALATVAFLEVGNGNEAPAFVIDLLDIQWWQAAVAIIVGLGLSPAPWILGLAVGRIQFTRVANEAHQRELDARKEAFYAQLAARDKYHADLMDQEKQRYADLEKINEKNAEAAEEQRRRADSMTDALVDATEAIRAGNHIINEFTRAAREVAPDGRIHPEG